MQFAIPVQQVRVAARSLDGVWSDGYRSLKPLAGTHSSAETVLDRLNDRDLFLPVHIAGDRDRAVILLNEAQIARPLVRDRQAGDADAARHFIDKHAVLRIPSQA
jgi:hypothetical protein